MRIRQNIKLYETPVHLNDQKWCCEQQIFNWSSRIKIRVIKWNEYSANSSYHQNNFSCLIFRSINTIYGDRLISYHCKRIRTRGHRSARNVVFRILNGFVWKFVPIDIHLSYRWTSFGEPKEFYFVFVCFLCTIGTYSFWFSKFVFCIGQ